jgi:hypothetical protein
MPVIQIYLATSSKDRCALACASLAESRRGGRKRAFFACFWAPVPQHCGKQKGTRRRHTKCLCNSTTHLTKNPLASSNVQIAFVFPDTLSAICIMSIAESAKIFAKDRREEA